MKIEAGKYYIDGHGQKHGPMVAECNWFLDERRWSFFHNGRRMAIGDFDHPDHLVAGWVEPAAEGPVRTVARREIVPGVYGRILTDGIVEERAVVSLTFKDGGPASWRAHMDAHELRSAAMILSQLAEALDDA